MRRSILLFALMALAQWLVPLHGIRQNEQVLREGRPLLFRTAPIDPHDPFRGEYVVLRFALEDLELPQDELQPWSDGEHAYLVLQDSAGVAMIGELQRERPMGEKPFVICTVEVRDWARSSESGIGGVWIDLPFDRFYLQQGKGRPTEVLMWQQDAEPDEELPSFALVRVLDGRAVIEDLIVGDRSIQAWLKDE